MIFAIYETYHFIIDKGDIVTKEKFLTHIYNAALAKGPIRPSEGFVDRAIYNRMAKHLDGVKLLHEDVEQPDKNTEY